MWHVHTMEYYLTMKRNEVWIHAIAWMNIENIMLIERSQIENVTYCMILYIYIYIYIHTYICQNTQIQIPKVD